MSSRRTTIIGGTVGVVLLLAVATLLVGVNQGATPPAPPPPAAQVNANGINGRDELARIIEQAQRSLQDNPNDYQKWALLGGAYVEQARITADPSYYPKSEGALQKSLDLNSTDNDLAMTGMGQLSNARHEFATAADWARKALAINEFGSRTYGVLADALTQLGNYDGATQAIQKMLELKPGVSSFTRASYNLELHGNIDGARAALEQALTSSFSPSDFAFCRLYLGQLAFNQGELDEADKQYDAGLRETADDPNLLYGKAQVAAARGEVDTALAGYAKVTALRPLPQYLLEYGNYLFSLGRTDEAKVQYGLFETTQQIFKVNGVQDNLSAALLAADQGDGKAAVAAGEAEWALRKNVDAADALGWALHSAGRDAEALKYAQQATAIGGRNALFIYHRGMIEKALGQQQAARASLDAALRINPYFSPIHEADAKAALADLGGPL